MNVERWLTRVAGGRPELARLWFELQMRSARHPVWFRPLIRLRRPDGAGVLGSDTELVVEGFPRSGNTFAVAAMRVSQPRAVRLAHHTHAPAQVLTATRRKIPTLVLIRRPADAVVSLLVRRPALTASQAFRAYLDFYRRIRPVAGDYVTAGFEEVTTDFGAVIERLNARFGTSFSAFETNEVTIRRCTELVEQMDRADTGGVDVDESTVARPSQARNALKKEKQSALDDVGADLIEAANRVYAAFTDEAGG